MIKDATRDRWLKEIILNTPEEKALFETLSSMAKTSLSTLVPVLPVAIGFQSLLAILGYAIILKRRKWQNV